MKKLNIIITLAFCCIFTSCKGVVEVENVKEGDYFLLLKDEKTISINIFEENKIKEIRSFPINENSIFATDKKRRVVVLDTAKNIILLYDIGSSMELKMSVPFEMEVISLLLNDENLFVGGKLIKRGWGNEMLIQYHLQNNEWYQLEIPENVRLPGKAIDDLVVNDSLLIAVDNIWYPKFVLFYHLNTTGKLIFSHSKQVVSNGAYEHIHQAKITPKYLGLKSTSWKGGGTRACFEFITIYDNLDLTSVFVVSVKRQKCLDDYEFFNDFLIIGNKLFIANKEKGLGIFEIKESYFYKFSEDDITSPNVQATEDMVNYTQYKNEEIIHLTKIPNEEKIVLTIRNSLGEIRHEIIEA